MFNTCGRWAFLNILYLLCRGGYYPPDFLQFFFCYFSSFTGVLLCDKRTKSAGSLSTSRTLNRLGRAPRPHASGCFSGLHNLLQANAARVIYILNVMRLAFIAAMHTPLLYIDLRFAVFGEMEMSIKVQSKFTPNF